MIHKGRCGSSEFSLRDVNGFYGEFTAFIGAAARKVAEICPVLSVRAPTNPASMWLGIRCNYRTSEKEHVRPIWAKSIKRF